MNCPLCHSDIKPSLGNGPGYWYCECRYSNDDDRDIADVKRDWFEKARKATEGDPRLAADTKGDEK